MRYTDTELEELFRGGESEIVERKPSIAQRNEIRQTICAFSNDLSDRRRPGVIFVGVEDNGEWSQFSVTDEALRSLADIRSDGNILPFPQISVEKKNLHGNLLAVVEVEPSSNPPVRFNGRCWIRVGSSNRSATREEEIRLSEKRRFKLTPFDLRPVEQASLNDLDLEQFTIIYLPASVAPEIIEENSRSLVNQMQSMRFLTLDDPPFPTVVSCLVLANDPTIFLPGAYIQFLRLDGTSLTDPIRDQEKMSGPLRDVMQAIDTKLESHISTATDVTSNPVETRTPDYPIVALQQLVRNAVLHRTYEASNAPVRVYWFEDRIEIYSPGGPYGAVTRENFGQPGVVDYRNPNLAEAMRNLGYVQRFGVGLQIARDALARNGNPPPEFTIEATHVLVTVRRRP